MSETRVLFVSGVPGDTKEATLKEIFEKHANVVHLQMFKHKGNNKLKGLGFVKFASVKEAIKVKTAMEGFEIDGRVIQLEYAEER